MFCRNKNFKALSPETQETVIDALGREVNILHATARNVEASGLDSTRERESADYISEIRKKLQRD